MLLLFVLLLLLRFVFSQEAKQVFVPKVITKKDPTFFTSVLSEMRQLFDKDVLHLGSGCIISSTYSDTG